jgi:sortase (surface protein transpeptidase)
MKIRTGTWIALVVIVIAVAVFGYTFAHAFYLSPADEVSLPDIHATENIPPSEKPSRIQIPAIGVDANIQDVGIGKTGNMAVPTNYTDVGWYRYGTVPGQVGSAVIDGHVDNGAGLAAVFKRLGELQRGDDIYILTETGRKLHFKVEEIGHYSLADVPLQALFNRKDAPRLNLITCEGTWIPSKKEYDERMIVYSVLVDQ